MSEAPPPAAPRPLGPGRAALVRAGLLLALLLAALGQTVTAGALPAVAADLHGGDRLPWVVTSYLLAAALVLPVYGRLGDLVGRKGLFLLALLVFVAGSALAGWARTMDELIVFRALQGLGAGGLVVGAQSIAATVAPPRWRGRFPVLLGAVFGLAVAVGPAVGGLLTDHVSWRWCCYLGVPLGLLALVAAVCAPRLPRPAGRTGAGTFGALLTAAATLCLVLLTSWGGTDGDWDGRTVLGIGLGALGAVLLWVAVRYFARQRTAPRLPTSPSPASRPPGRGSFLAVDTLVGVAVGIALYGACDQLPAHLHRMAGASATRTGLLTLPLLGGAAVAALVAGRLASRTGRFRAYPILGCGVATVGMWLLSGLGADTSRLTYGLWTGVLGLGVGLVLPVLVMAVRGAGGPADAGPATGGHRGLRRVGGGIGVAVLVAVFAHRAADAVARHLPTGVRDLDRDALTPEVVHSLPAALRDGHIAAHVDALPRVFGYLVPVLVLGFLLALLLKENPLASQTDQQDPAVPAARGLADTVTNGSPSPTADQRAPESYADAYASDPYVTDAYTTSYASGDQSRADAQLLAGPPVCGTVAHHDGSTVPRAALTLIDVGGRQVGRGATGEDGRYALSTPGAGAYVLIAAASGHQPQAVSVTVGERPVELDVVLGGAGRLAGAVRTADGTPVRDAMVTLTDVRGEVVASTRSGREGGYLITELVAGEYTLASSAPAYRPAALPVSVQAARETRQDIELAGGAVLRGTVRAGGGRTVEDARVTLLDAAGNVVDTATTGADGVFRFIDLSAGEYTVIAAGYPPVATVLRVAGGGRTERDLQLGYED
ncbi:MFS transporter [Streptomyces sp. 71268]|uniref:MFS transporter n=1 Tax=Streptomyces sp. 71268 TaxID=3002640 RepID=UPI0023FA2960|nr:MFS transporter [Streptomyces sp. 71268]WEV30011.1 MFS transporter [Streptomyces sp. 71268]